MIEKNVSNHDVDTDAVEGPLCDISRDEEADELKIKEESLFVVQMYLQG